MLHSSEGLRIKCSLLFELYICLSGFKLFLYLPEWRILKFSLFLSAAAAARLLANRNTTPWRAKRIRRRKLRAKRAAISEFCLLTCTSALRDKLKSANIFEVTRCSSYAWLITRSGIRKMLPAFTNDEYWLLNFMSLLYICIVWPK